MTGVLPSPHACAAFLIDVNEWLTGYQVRLVQPNYRNSPGLDARLL